MPTPPVYSSTACNGFTRTRRSSKSGIPSRRIKISLLLARREAAQKAAAGLPKFVHVVCVNLAWLKGDTNNQGQESKRTNRCTSTPQETPKKTWVQQGPSYTKYDTCTGFDRNETAPPKKNRNIFWCGSAAGAHHHQLPFSFSVEFCCRTRTRAQEQLLPVSLVVVPSGIDTPKDSWFTGKHCRCGGKSADGRKNRRCGGKI